MPVSACTIAGSTRCNAAAPGVCAADEVDVADSASDADDDDDDSEAAASGTSVTASACSKRVVSANAACADRAWDMREGNGECSV